jgi:hypothetical protein
MPDGAFLEDGERMLWPRKMICSQPNENGAANGAGLLNTPRQS